MWKLQKARCFLNSNRALKMMLGRTRNDRSMNQNLLEVSKLKEVQWRCELGLRTLTHTKYALDDRANGVRRRMRLILPNGSLGRQAGDRLS